MANVYRPVMRPTGQRPYCARTIALDGIIHRVAFDPTGSVDVIVSAAATTIGETGLAKLTEPAYVRGALTFQTYCHHHATSTAIGAYNPWSLPIDVRELFKEMLRLLGAKIEESTNEKDVWHVTVEEEDDIADVVAAICGTFHLYEAAASAGLYKWPNPFKVAIEDRIKRKVPGAPANDTNWPTIAPRFRFRIPMGTASAMRTDRTDKVREIVPALVAYGAPAAIIMMIKTMIEGLARILEQINLSLLDWWEESEFGESIATTSKGRRRRRVKAQHFTPQHHAELVDFADDARKSLDPNGWGLEEWRAFLTNPNIKPSVRKKAARNAPLFPNARGRFYSRSGVLDHWYRPAMRKAGLPTHSHYLRHCGVNDFLAYIDSRPDLTTEEKRAAKLAFGRRMGWKWPEVMLERYSLPQRKEAEIASSADWLRDRRARLDDLRSGLGLVTAATMPVASTDRQLSKLFRHRLAA